MLRHHKSMQESSHPWRTRRRRCELGRARGKMSATVRVEVKDEVTDQVEGLVSGVGVGIPTKWVVRGCKIGLQGYSHGFA